MKKAASLLLVLAMMFAMTMTSLAAEIGSITISGITGDATYEIYKLLDLESYDKDSGVYSYKVNAAWAEFFATDDGKDYFTVDTQGYATWTAAEDDATVAAFAQKALAYAKEEGIAPVKSSDNDGEFVITGDAGKFSGLELGYYLVDSTVGALCGLTTTNPDAAIVAKNHVPTVDKQVQEDSTNNWGDKDSADIGQDVHFRTTISVHAGAENYVLHDKMSDGLTFKGVTKIEHVVPGTGTHEVGVGDYNVVTAGLDDGCTFHVAFTKEFCDHLKTNDKVIVYYTATLNENAIIAGANENEAWLDFGEENETTHDTTETYTYGFDLVKTDGQNELIDGAEFLIYDAATGGNEVAVVKVNDDLYRHTQDAPGVNIVVKDGKVRVEGLDNGTYYLEEVVTPSGYNQLAARQQFIISDGNLDAVFSDGIYATGSGVHVVNKSGTMLPETGGMGTMMFIACGMAVALGTGVLLVTKKRMSMIQE